MGENLAQGLSEISTSMQSVSRMFQTAALTKGLEGGPYYDPEMAKLAYEQRRMDLNDLLIRKKMEGIDADITLKGARADKAKTPGPAKDPNKDVSVDYYTDPNTGKTYMVPKKVKPGEQPTVIPVTSLPEGTVKTGTNPPKPPKKPGVMDVISERGGQLLSNLLPGGNPAVAPTGPIPLTQNPKAPVIPAAPVAPTTPPIRRRFDASGNRIQ